MGNARGKVVAMPRFLRIITGDAKAFSNGTANANGTTNTLYFTAGPHIWFGETEEDVRGLLGTITPWAGVGSKRRS